MAIYHFSANTGTLGGGQSARAKYDYIAREGSQHEHRDARLHVESGNMPKFAAADAAAYWSAADDNERANGRLFKHIEIALPRELTFEQNLELARSFCDRIATSVPGGNLPYTFTIHAGGGSNPHFDVMFSERLNDAIDRGPEVWFSRAATGKSKTAADGGARKTVALKPKRWLYDSRKLWADLANDALAKAGHSARIDHRSLVDQRAEALAKGDYARAKQLDRAPGEHMGPKALGYEKRTGLKSKRRAHVERRQRERENIARDVAAVDRTAARYEKQIRADQDELRRERGLRAKDAITRRIAAERAAGKIPAPVVRPVSPAPAAASAAASQPKKTIAPGPAGAKPKFHSARIAVAVDHKANATIQQKIRREEQASLDFFESLNKKKEQESLEKFMREMRNALDSQDEQQELSKLAKRVEPIPDRVARANASRQAMQARKSSAPAPAAAAAAASQPPVQSPVQSQSQRAERAAAARRVLESMNAKPAPAPAAPAGAASSAQDEREQLRRIVERAISGKGVKKSDALIRAAGAADLESVDRLLDAGAAVLPKSIDGAAKSGNDAIFKKLVGFEGSATDHVSLSELAQKCSSPEARAKLTELAAQAKAQGGHTAGLGIDGPHAPGRKGSSAGQKGPSGPSGPR